MYIVVICVCFVCDMAGKTKKYLLHWGTNLQRHMAQHIVALNRILSASVFISFFQNNMFVPKQG